MSAFESIHKFVAKWEGGLSNNPNDRGGITNHGISLVFLTGFAAQASQARMLEELGVSLPISRQSIIALTKDQAKAIMRHEFWDKPKLAALPDRLAMFAYDSGVNHGPAQGVRFVQQAFNVLKNGGLAVDGLIGPRTLAAISAAPPGDILVQAIVIRRNYYERIVEMRPSQRVFYKGWLNRLNSLARFLETD